MSKLLVLDWRRCQGHGVCAAALGEQVSLDDWGYPKGVDARGWPVPPELASAAGLAVASCPQAALRLVRAPAPAAAADAQPRPARK